MINVLPGGGPAGAFHGGQSGIAGSPGDENGQLMSMQNALFDEEMTLCCKVSSDHTLLYGSGGLSYGLGATALASGCYQWKHSMGALRISGEVRALSGPGIG